MRRLVVLMTLLGLFQVSTSLAAAPSEADVDAALRARLKIAPGNSVPEHKSAFVDLNDDGKLDAVVFLTDPDSCGSGGCTLEIFKGTSSGLKGVSGTTLVREPIYMSPRKVKGWHVLVVESRYVGMATVRFDGRRYSVSAEKKASNSDMSGMRRLL